MLHAPDLRDRDHILKSMDRLVNELDSITGTLRSLRHTVSQRKLEYHNLLSPACSLPFELLRLIFIDALPDVYLRSNVNYIYAPRTGRTVSFNVAQVCRRWREVALAIPTLWNLVYIESKPPHHSIPAKYGVRQANELLSRCGDSSTCVSMNAYSASHLCNDIGDTRAHTTTLDIECFAMGQFSFAPSLESFGRLERLTLDSVSTKNLLKDVVRLFSERLTHFHLVLEPKEAAIADQMFSAQWPHLRVLVMFIEDNFHIDFQRLAQGFPVLEQLMLRLIDHDITPGEPTPDGLTLPHLRTLGLDFSFQWIEDNAHGVIPDLLDGLVLPSLMDVALAINVPPLTEGDFYPGSIFSPVEAVSRLVTRSRPNMRLEHFLVDTPALFDYVPSRRYEIGSLVDWSVYKEMRVGWYSQHGRNV